MTGKTETFAKVDKADRLKIVYLGFAKRIKDFGLPGVQPKEPDWKVLEEAMKKGGKPTVFAIRFASGKFIAEVSNGGTVLTVAALDTNQEKDRNKKRDLLKAISDRSELVSNADLQAFDKANPDPQKIAAAKKKVDDLKSEIGRLRELKSSRKKKFDDMDRGEQEVGLTNWAKTKNYDRYVTCLFWIDVGRDAKTVVDEFVKDGAARPVKISAAARKEAVDSLAAGSPKLDKVEAEVRKVVDTVLVPMYNKDTAASLDKAIKEKCDELAKCIAEYKAAGGK